MQGASSYEELRRLITGFSGSVALSTVAKLGIADHLSEGPKTAAELARLSGVKAEFLARVLRFLSSEGVFDHLEDGCFALNSMSQWLRTGVDRSLHPRAVFAGSAFAWTAWSKFLESITSGKSGVEEAFGETLFGYLKSHPDEGAAFNTFMVDQTAGSVRAILGAYDFAGYQEFVDVGGGRGALVAGVLQANSQLRGRLFDVPEVIATADAVLQQAGVSDRCDVVAGDFFKAVPEGADLYALKYILHDWSDEACLRILANCRSAMAPGGRLLIIEHVIPEESGPHFSKFMDLNMMVLTSGGRERTEQEFRRMLEGAHLQLRRSVSTEFGLSVLECEPQ